MNERAAQWIRRYGVRALLHDLERLEGFAITSQSVYHWIAGRRSPQPRRACALDMQSVYGRVPGRPGVAYFFSRPSSGGAKSRARCT